MSTNKKPPVESLRDSILEWRDPSQAGGGLPSIRRLLLGDAAGMPIPELARGWAESLLAYDTLRGVTRVRSAIRAVVRDPSPRNVRSLARALDRHGVSATTAAYADYLVAHITDDRDDWARLARHVAMVSRPRTPYERVLAWCAMRQALLCRPLAAAEEQSAILLLDVPPLDVWIAAHDAASPPDDVPAEDAPADDEIPIADMADFMDFIAEDRAEITPRPSARPPAPSKTVVVVPKMPDPASLPFARRELAKGFAKIAGVGLPLVARGDVVAHRRRLEARFPYAPELVASILRHLAPTEIVRLPPLIVFGGPGTGKTALARYVFTTLLGTAWTQYPGAGVADGSIAGTSSQWSSARTTTALDVIRSSGVANPGVLVDEIDKVGTSRHNGNVADAILAMIERSQAARYRDPGLEVEVDISHVSWILTANDKSAIPAPLRDRCRVVEMPTPEARHLEPLLPGILEDLAAERGIDPRWMSPLAGDELALVRRHWKGGSVRRLKRAVEALVDTRDAGRPQ